MLHEFDEYVSVSCVLSADVYALPHESHLCLWPSCIVSMCCFKFDARENDLPQYSHLHYGDFLN